MMNNTLSKVEKENPCRKVPSPDGVVAYHAALSRLRPGFKSRSGRHSNAPIIFDVVAFYVFSSHQLDSCSGSGSGSNGGSSWCFQQ